MLANERLALTTMANLVVKGLIVPEIQKDFGDLIRESFRFLGAVMAAWLCVACLSFDLMAAQDDIVFTAALDKTEYAAEEPINLTFTLKNNGKKAVYVNKRFYFASEEAPRNQKEVFVTVTSPSGQKLPFKFPYETGYPKSDYFELLDPGKEVKSEYPRNLRGNFEMNEPGVYTLTVVYQNVFGRELGLDVFSERLTAETLKFEIKK